MPRSHGYRQVSRMSCEIIDLPRTNRQQAPCDPRGCAGLCTPEGAADAYRLYASRMQARAGLVLLDPGLAEEAMQEAFLRAWTKCASFDPSAGTLAGWLLVITRNVAIDMAKARVRRPTADPELFEAISDETSPAISETDRVLLRHQLGEALMLLGCEHRTAVVEIVLRDRMYADVAAQLGVPAGTLRSRVHYALRKLRAVLESQSDPDVDISPAA
jgi:RNA polymerase sigma-70 factor (ECF subfamily)